MSTGTKFTEALRPYTSPHRSIRNVLSLQSKVSPEKPFIIHYNGDGRREELPFVEVNARAHQTANMLQEDLSLKPGDHVAVLIANPADTAVFYLACWILGAVVVPLNSADDDSHLAARLNASEATVCLVAHDYLSRAQNFIPPDCQLVQVGGIANEDIPYFNELVKNMPNTFFNDHAEPTLASPALWISSTESRSQGDLLFTAQNLAFAQAFTGNQRIMTLLPLYNINEIILSLLMPLLVGGSTVLNPNFVSADLWRQITAERVQIASVTPDMLQTCIDFADAQLRRGEPIWGSGVHQQDLTRFRHLICADPNLDPALIQTFQERLGLMVYTIIF
ncbi:MAG: class I adenylate-forming enzyme family protein [Chloroflexota bacterium]